MSHPSLAAPVNNSLQILYYHRRQTLES